MLLSVWLILIHWWTTLRWWWWQTIRRPTAARVCTWAWITILCRVTVTAAMAIGAAWPRFTAGAGKIGRPICCSTKCGPPFFTWVARGSWTTLCKRFIFLQSALYEWLKSTPTLGLSEYISYRSGTCNSTWRLPVEKKNHNKLTRSSATIRPTSSCCTIVLNAKLTGKLWEERWLFLIPFSPTFDILVLLKQFFNPCCALWTNHKHGKQEFN